MFSNGGGWQVRDCSMEHCRALVTEIGFILCCWVPSTPHILEPRTKMTIPQQKTHLEPSGKILSLKACNRIPKPSTRTSASQICCAKQPASDPCATAFQLGTMEVECFKVHLGLYRDNGKETGNYYIGVI